MEDEKRLAEKLRLIKQALRGVRRVEVASESAREAVAQGVLARGGRRVKDALLAVRGKASVGARRSRSRALIPDSMLKGSEARTKSSLGTILILESRRISFDSSMTSH